MGQNVKAPDKIYLQVCGECPEEDCKNCKFEDLEDNVTWCKDRIYKKDIEYIRKDALLEWWMNKFADSPLPGITITKYLTNFLESL